MPTKPKPAAMRPTYQSCHIKFLSNFTIKAHSIIRRRILNTYWVRLTFAGKAIKPRSRITVITPLALASSREFTKWLHQVFPTEVVWVWNGNSEDVAALARDLCEQFSKL